MSRPGGEVCDDLDLLVPAFRARVELVLSDMEAQGLSPRVFETWRSPERVARLVAKGTGSARSFHTLGLAVDIIHREHMWFSKPGNRALGVRFWTCLEASAIGHGLVHGAGSTRVDLPHIQALPHAAFWRVCAMQPDELEEYVAGYLADKGVIAS